MSKELQDQVAIVTGGSRGYGMGMAEALVNAGAKVWITGRNEERLMETAAKIGAQGFVADAADGDAWDRLMGVVMADSGRLDILVNNAGEGVNIAPTSELSDEVIERSIASNLTGALLGCRRAAGVMSKQKSGLIVNIGSVCAKHAWAEWGIYSAAKAGLLQFSRSLLIEMRPHGVRVTSILPSWGQTEFTEAAGLDARDANVSDLCIAPADMGNLLVDIACRPSHLVTEEVTLWPTVQPMTQL